MNLVCYVVTRVHGKLVRLNLRIHSQNKSVSKQGLRDECTERPWEVKSGKRKGNDLD